MKRKASGNETKKSFENGVPTNMAATVLLNEPNLETFTLFWLDAEVNNSDENRDAQQQLRAIINNLKTFKDRHECEQNIYQVPKEDRLVLIVNGPFGREVVPRIHQLQQVSSIYVYCMDKKTNEKWTKEFAKVKFVTVRIDELISRIQSDQKGRMKVEEPLSINIFNPDLSTTGLNGEFIHAQLLIHCLCRIKSAGTDYNELISLCKEEYKGNTTQLSIIEEFQQDYAPSKALWWYTRESFLYKMLNKALRVQNIDVLFLLHFFVQDIHRQLKHSQCQTRLTMYRGQLMSSDELDSLRRSIGDFISINSFLSTTLNRQQALLFPDTSDNFERVLFEIDADPHAVTTKSFANIASHTDLPTKPEILFMLGSIFQLTALRRGDNREWIIQMTLCDDDDSSLKQLFEDMKIGDGETNLLSFGRVLTSMGKFDLAEKYFRRLLSQIDPDDPLVIVLCQNLGVVAAEKDAYDTSLEMFQKSLEIMMRTRPSDHVNIGKAHNCIGEVFRKKGDDNQALESYSKAVSIFEQAHDENHPDMALFYNNICLIYCKQRQYFEALTYCENSLAIKQSHLPADHSDLGLIYNNIGFIHGRLGHYELALEHHNRSLKIQQKSLPPQHPSIATSYHSIGEVHEYEGKLELALAYYQKAATIYRHALPLQHPNVVKIEQDIQRVSARLK